MSRELLKFSLEVEIEIDGKHPGNEILHERLIDAINDGFPNMAFEDDELDCAVFINSWCIDAHDR